MLIDKVLKDNPNLVMMGRKLSDAFVFRVHEGIEDYRKDKKYSVQNRTVAYHLTDDQKGIRMPTFFPYNNLVVQFDDGLDWYVTLDKIESVVYEDDNIRMVGNMFLKNDVDEITKLRDIMMPVENGFIEPQTFPVMLLSEKGHVIDIGVSDHREQLFCVHSEIPMAYKEHIQWFAMDTISSSKKFLEIVSCKNISHEEIHPPAKLQKKRKKSGKLPFKSYYILKVNPIGRKPGTLKPGQGLWDNRVHYCRGHFKEYSPDKPLFGKYTGRYWFNPQIRGSKKAGVIEKDYEL